jgi:CRISPR-associated endoribonuclease Cas6
MRLHFKIPTSNKTIPFVHQHLLTGTIHKWIGYNHEHGEISLYTFSQLEMGKETKNGLLFEHGTSFFFSSYNIGLIKKIIKGIQTNPTMFHDLTVSEIFIQEDPDLTNRELFMAASPIFIKRKNGEKTDHITYTDHRANACLTETLQTKMKDAGLEDETLEISFDANYPKAGTKLITYNGIKNRANWCPVIIKGKPETKLFAWNVGLGNSTGIGFGAIK